MAFSDYRTRAGPQVREYYRYFRTRTTCSIRIPGWLAYFRSRAPQFHRNRRNCGAVQLRQNVQIVIRSGWAELHRSDSDHVYESLRNASPSFGRCESRGILGRRWLLRRALDRRRKAHDELLRGWRWIVSRREQRIIRSLTATPKIRANVFNSQSPTQRVRVSMRAIVSLEKSSPASWHFAASSLGVHFRFWRNFRTRGPQIFRESLTRAGVYILFFGQRCVGIHTIGAFLARGARVSTMREEPIDALDFVFAS